MKLKPLGEKLANYTIIEIVSFICIPIAFHFEWYIFFWICVVANVLSGARTLDILCDVSYRKYGLWGFRGPDPLFKYEPGDKEYENAKHWQDDDDDDADDDDKGKD